MTAPSLDTQALVRRLMATGLSKDQAEAIITAIRASRNGDLTTFVTKSDVAEARFDIRT